MPETAIIVIPARMASTRYPNKPMAVIRGRSMIERVWRIATAVKNADEALIATDDECLKAFAESFGANVILTSPECRTGTDRVAETSRHLAGKHTIYFSFQGDAVLTPPWVIEQVLEAMLSDSSIRMATPAVQLKGPALQNFVASKQAGSTTGTTVTFDCKGNALYFSKALIPHTRETNDSNRPVYRHIGLYGYRTDVLQQLSHLPEGPFEKAEKLEQLRALENGIPIRIIQVDYHGRTHGAVDRPEDVATVEAIIAREGELV
ncbi:MAG: 3-deoxy-manno-octulosonate cytidylyltransferase [Candidatus Marsarchaeota archaeon]|nr:3-deoxy-manno-octulosonate cytidylyltransferase [Candidatus Marsarchaeota archaeon]